MTLIQSAVLADLPHRGRRDRWPGTRELIVPGTPLIVSLPRRRRSYRDPAYLPRRPPLARGAGGCPWPWRSARGSGRGLDAPPSRRAIRGCVALMALIPARLMSCRPDCVLHVGHAHHLRARPHAGVIPHLGLDTPRNLALIGGRKWSRHHSPLTFTVQRAR